MTWALEIVTYGRSGMLVGCVGTGELKIARLGKKERFVKLASSVSWHLPKVSGFQKSRRAIAKIFV
ncbi:MAG TPA: hypothetical protein VF656_03065 [Pyrinomonadaceae bacterium]